LIPKILHCFFIIVFLLFLKILITNHTITYKNAPISFSDSGEGKVLVFLHGFLENLNMWQNIVPTFANKYRIITIDLLGHGQSGCVGYLHTMENMAEMVAHVLYNLKVQNAFFTGHSMGGYVTLAIAELFPTLVKGIILLNSTAYEDDSERKLNRERAIKAVKHNYQTFVNMAVANLFYEESRTVLVSIIKNTQKEALKTPLQGIIAALEGMKIRKDRTFILQENKFVVALILGTRDTVLPYDLHKKQAENTGVNVYSLTSGHMSHLENTEETISAIYDFLTINSY
jgi:pimeloyl-ACP methyl ester carboxylesterase